MKQIDVPKQTKIKYLLNRRHLPLWLFWSCFLGSRNRCLRFCGDGRWNHRLAASLWWSFLEEKNRLVLINSTLWAIKKSRNVGHLDCSRFLLRSNRRRHRRHLPGPRSRCRGKRSLDETPLPLGCDVNRRPPPVILELGNKI